MGTKIRYLAAIASDLGMAVESVDYQDLDNPDARGERLKTLLAKEADSVVLVGSSIGGYVSTLAATAGHGMGCSFWRRPCSFRGIKSRLTTLPYPSLRSSFGDVRCWLLWLGWFSGAANPGLQEAITNGFDRIVIPPR